MILGKSEEWVKRFRKVEYFGIVDLFYFLIIVVGYSQAYFRIAK